MSEVRTTSSTGGQKGMKPQRYSLLPKEGLDAIAEVFGFGEGKYAAHNWRRGYEWDKSFDALLRHSFAAQNGETYDDESGLPHLAHAGFHVLVLLTWLAEQGEGADNDFDTRWPAAAERARRKAEEEESIPKMLKDKWGEVEPLDDFEVTDLRPYTTESAGIFERARDESKDVLDELHNSLMKPTHLSVPVGVEWREPEMPTLENVLAARRAVSAVIPARFNCGEFGIEDTHHPLSDEQNEAAEQGMIRIASDGDREIWAKPEALEVPTPTYSISVASYDEEHDHEAAVRFYLNHWANRPGI